MSRPPEAAQLLRLAVDAAHAAGALLVSRRPPGGDLVVTSTKSSPTDIVTAMDTAAERLVLQRLHAARPADGFLGEEGADARGTSGVVWVVDPIDGTVNYLYDLPAYAVSIGVQVDGEVVAGVVHNPVTRETWTAVRGGGACRNDVAVHASDCAQLPQALVATGFGYSADRRARQGELLRALLPRVRDIRRIGAASLDLCAVATGRVDAYYERGLKPWDLAAGGLVAWEAGARVEGLHGRAAGEDLVLAAPPSLFDALHDLLAPLGPDRD
jgi:myo-inositol-1(or 4)-monophosphatase